MPDSADVCPRCAAMAGVQRIAGDLQRCAACHFITPCRTSATWRPVRAGDGLPLLPGATLRDRYRLVRVLGRGAHGIAYLAEHIFVRHPCVVKVLATAAADGPATVRLREEARAGFRVNHPNVTRVIDCDHEHDRWFFAMEYADGLDLAQVTTPGTRMHWQQVLQIAREAAGALAAIHQAGLIHGDVKPGNVILDRAGHLKLTDLGVARLVREWSVGGGPTGTLLYSAPEVLEDGHAADPRSDLYSLGLVLFELLVGSLPHGSGSVYQAVLRSERSVSWPDDAPADVPSWLVEAVLRLLAPRPQERFASADALESYFARPRGPTSAARAERGEEEPRPRALAVLPFANDGEPGADDWLGHALADVVVRGLSETSGVYVVDRDRLLALVEREGGDPQAGRLNDEVIRRAGRLVGAATVIGGSYCLFGGVLRVQSWSLGADAEARLPVAQVQGLLSRLIELEGALVAGVRKSLRLEDGQRPNPPFAAAAQEHFVLAKQSYLRGDYETAIRRAQSAVEIDPEFIEAIGFIGVCHARRGQFEQAETQHRQHERLALEAGQDRQVMEARANMGVLCYYRGDYERAYEHYIRAVEAGDEPTLPVEHAQIWNNLGFVLFRLGRHAEAETSFVRSIEAHRAYGALVSLIGPYNGLGNVLVAQQRYEEAREYFRRALVLAEEVDDRVNIGVAHMHFGRCASYQGRWAEARHELALALNALQDTGFWHGEAQVYEYMADLNLQLGDFAEALRCADRRIDLAREHDNSRMEEAARRQRTAALRGLDGKEPDGTSDA